MTQKHGRAQDFSRGGQIRGPGTKVPAVGSREGELAPVRWGQKSTTNCQNTWK